MRNPKNIRAFLAVARSGSIGRSAAFLQRTQSAVSRSVQELEREFGVALFERHPHGMELATCGRVLLPRAAAAFAEMEAASAAFAAGLPEGGWVRTAPIFTLSLSLQRLHVLTELAEQNSMAAVASALGVSQPAVSQAVREIETGVGTALFTRTGGKTWPTALGAILASHTRRALTELRIAADEVASAGTVRGKVIVGSLSLGRAKLLPRAISRLLALFPDLTIHTREGSYEHLAWLLRESEIDFIVGALRPLGHTERFLREVVWTDRLAVIARADHPLARQAAISLHDLAAFRWVLPGHGTPTRELLKTALQLHGLPPATVQVETADLTIMLGLLLETDMITAASPSLFHRELEYGSIKTLPLDLPGAAQPIGMYYRAGAVPSEAAGRLMELLREIGAL